MTDAQRKRIARAASAFHVPRQIARELLALPTPTRNELLAELVRVGPGAVLAYTRTQPSLPTHQLTRLRGV
ncbi:hypothetical protein [Microbacterium sp. R86528]|uniref:hypothetical protein n=1 Tax=Microbacterium sp. R86528 TaxID=3093864 RepID=UPI0037C7E7DF